MQMTNMTEIEFGNLYNATNSKSLGHLIAQVDQLIASTYGCEGAVCTPTELSVKQWTKSTVTQTVPENLEGNRFLGRNGQNCVSDAWKLDGVYETFPCSEFSNWVSKFDDPRYTFNEQTTQLILNIDGQSEISLDDPIRATSFINFVLTNDQSDETLQVLKNTYQNANMANFLSIMRIMVQDFLLGGPCQKTKMTDLLNGYKSNRTTILYDDKDGGL